MTKAELEAKVRFLEGQVEGLERKLAARPLDTWIATNDPGQPVCVPFKDDLHSMQVYLTENGGEALGVIVSHDAGIVLAAGLIPGEVVMDEIRWLRRS